MAMQCFWINYDLRKYINDCKKNQVGGQAVFGLRFLLREKLRNLVSVQQQKNLKYLEL